MLFEGATNVYVEFVAFRWCVNSSFGPNYSCRHGSITN